MNVNFLLKSVVFFPLQHTNYDPHNPLRFKLAVRMLTTRVTFTTGTELLIFMYMRLVSTSLKQVRYVAFDDTGSNDTR